jgi:hypothetical protein
MSVGVGLERYLVQHPVGLCDGPESKAWVYTNDSLSSHNFDRCYMVPLLFTVHSIIQGHDAPRLRLRLSAQNANRPQPRKANGTT